jgi:hypothetical protein
MANDLVEASAPCLAALRRGRPAGARDAAAVGGAGTPVRHLVSFLVPLDELGFHVFDADSEGAVQAAGERARSGNVRIMEALL